MNTIKNKETPYIAFATQKGGVGKTTCSVVVASILHYQLGYNVLVIDCDYPQGSASRIRTRDMDTVTNDEYYAKLFSDQQTLLSKKAYTILCSPAYRALITVESFVESSTQPIDLVIFDLPGTIDSEGVLQCVLNMDYLFIPIAADRIILDSSLSFALTINKLVVGSPNSLIKGLHPFWYKVDARVRTHLYDEYDESIKELGLTMLNTRLPNSTRFDKETEFDHRPFFRSTLFAPHPKFIKGSNMSEFVDEIVNVINLRRDE